MRPKKVPQRTCIGCRTTRPKRELIRIVRTPDNAVVLDTTGKMNGRGAYICPSEGCIQKALDSRALTRALQVAIEPEVVGQLAAELRERP